MAQPPKGGLVRGHDKPTNTWELRHLLSRWCNYSKVILSPGVKMKKIKLATASAALSFVRGGCKRGPNLPQTEGNQLLQKMKVQGIVALKTQV